MPQNLLIPKAGAAGATHSRRLLRNIHIGFRLVRYQSAPWLVLAITPLKLLFGSGVERIHGQVRYFKAITRIDFVGVYGLLNDLLW